MQLAFLQRESLFKGNYLPILLRELKSILPKPVKIAEYSCISPKVIAILSKHGLTDTMKFHRHLRTKAEREVFADKMMLILNH